MSDLKHVVCVDFGGTKVVAQLLGYSPQGQSGIRPLYSEISVQMPFDTTKPNSPDVDYRNLCESLDPLSHVWRIDGISVGFAARLDRDGVIQKGGSLNWAGRNLGAMLTGRYGVPAIVANDGVMFAADELVFGVLNDPMYYGRSVLVVVPGTGIGTCLALWTGDRHLIVPGEGQHNPYDRSVDPNGCNCGVYCYESAPGSGSGYERAGIDPLQLDDETDVANMAPPLGALVASYVRPMPSLIDLVVVSGRLAHKRPSLMAAIKQATTRELCGYVPTPEFILGSSEVGGLRGSLANERLANQAN